jgi:flavin reductase (DIM6/NTAB) family NADH-FMN oxidoreductase RutF
MAKKIEIPIEFSTRLINHGPMVLVSTGFKEERDVAPFSWVMPASQNPRLFALAVVPKRYTYNLIEKSREFILNIPGVHQKELVMQCGKVSGRDVDKFDELKIKTLKASKVAAPIIEECIAHLECTLAGEYVAGDHKIILGEVVSILANEKILNADGVIDLHEAKMLHHLGSDKFCTGQYFD